LPRGEPEREQGEIHELPKEVPSLREVIVQKEGSKGDERLSVGHLLQG